MAVHLLGPKNSRERTRDECLRNAMTVMKSANPWNTQRFLDEVSDPAWNATFDIVDQSKIRETYFDVNTVVENIKIYVQITYFLI